MLSKIKQDIKEETREDGLNTLYKYYLSDPITQYRGQLNKFQPSQIF